MAHAKTQAPDRFQVWFWRLVQFVGLLIVCYETLIEQRERPWLDLTALSMIAGAQGILLMLKGARAMKGGADRE